MQLRRLGRAVATLASSPPARKSPSTTTPARWRTSPCPTARRCVCESSTRTTIPATGPGADPGSAVGGSRRGGHGIAVRGRGRGGLPRCARHADGTVERAGRVRPVSGRRGVGGSQRTVAVNDGLEGRQEIPGNGLRPSTRKRMHFRALPSTLPSHGFVRLACQTGGQDPRVQARVVVSTMSMQPVASRAVDPSDQAILDALSEGDRRTRE